MAHGSLLYTTHWGEGKVHVLNIKYLDGPWVNALHYILGEGKVRVLNIKYFDCPWVNALHYILGRGRYSFNDIITKPYRIREKL